MSDPFRESETTALARVEDLERENQRLTEELEEARALLGENHQVYVKHLEDQIRDLKRDDEARWAERLAQRQMVPAQLTPEMLKAQERMTYWLVGAALAIAIAISLISALVNK